MPLNEAPVVRIVAKGTALRLSLGVQVLKFTYEDTEKKDDILNVVFADPFGKLVDSDQFLENSEWTVQWGFPGRLTPARKVIVKRPKFRFGEVEVEALDKGSGLKIEENWTTLKDTSIRSIITQIANKHGLTPVLDEIERAVPFFAFGGMTDFEVLKYFQSRTEDHVFRILSEKLMFVRRKLNVPAIASFEYAPGRGSRLISFEIEVKDQDNAKTAGQTSTVSVNPHTFKTEVFKADERSTSLNNLGNRRTNDGYKSSFSSALSTVALSSTGGRVQKVAQNQSTGKSLPMPPKTSDELAALAKSKRSESLLDTVEGTFEIMASSSDPFMKPGDIINIQGIGLKYSGGYRIKNILHDLSDGYKYTITAGRNAVGATINVPLNPINGPINRSVPRLITAEVNDVLIRGSSSGSIYGQAGRLVLS